MSIIVSQRGHNPSRYSCLLAVRYSSVFKSLERQGISTIILTALSCLHTDILQLHLHCNMQQQPQNQQQQQRQPQVSQQEQLQKLITAANANQLTHEQLAQLRNFLGAQGGTAALGLQPLAGNAAGSSSNNANINMQMPSMPMNLQQQSPPQPQLQQQQQQQQQMTQSPAPLYQNLNQQGQPGNSNNNNNNNGAPGNPDPRALIAQLQTRITNIDLVLKRTDITDQDRNRLSQELDNNKRSLAAFVNQVKVAAAAQHQMQSMQNAGQANNSSVNELQIAQQRAMAQKAQQIQAQMQQQQQIPHQNQLNNFQQQQQGPSNSGGLNLTLPPNIAPRSSPSMQAQSLPQMQGQNHQQQQMSPMPQQPQQMPQQQQRQQQPPQFQQQPPQPANTASPAMSANSPPNVNMQLQGQQNNQAKRRQQAPHLQQQSSSQGNGGGRSTPQPPQQQQQQQGSNQSNMQQHQQQQQQQSMQMQMQQQQQSNQQQQQIPPPPPSTVSASSTTLPSAGVSFSIPENLSMPATQPEAFPASRPTLSSGLATNPILGAPAVTAPPLANLPSTRTAGAGGPSQPSAQGSNAASGAATPQASTSAAPSLGGPAPTLGQPGPLALKNAEGRPYNKRKLQELVASIDPNQQLEAQVEDVSGSASHGIMRGCRLC